MSILSLPPTAFSAQYTEQDLFTLETKQSKHTTVITMRVLTHIINTKDLPHTLQTLKKQLPSILVATCFNDEELPFAQEVQRTEIGHLFEHILLEYLCKFKIASGSQDATYSGRTYWNWKRDPQGTFQIVIKAGYKEGEIFQAAFTQTIQLVKAIMSPETIHLPLQQTPSVPTFTSSLATTEKLS